MMAAEGHSDQLPSDTEVRMKQRRGTELLRAEQMAPTDIQGSRPRGRCRPHWMWLWLQVPGPMPASLWLLAQGPLVASADVALGLAAGASLTACGFSLRPWAGAGLSGSGWGFRLLGQCWLVCLWLQALGWYRTLGLGLLASGPLQASLAVALSPMASGCLPG